jgi:hypothetical protein
MGREATCQCTWGEVEANCKVLLEGAAMIFRLGIRRRIPLSSLKEVSTHGDDLVFRVGEDRVSLHLGSDQAQRWAKAIVAPLPSLARKLGISADTRLRLVGEVQCKELETAIAEAGDVSGKNPDLLLICGEQQDEIFNALHRCIKDQTAIPIWVVYPKGPRSEVKESALRDLLRGHGFMDTKVAAVSAKFTALRFNRLQN